MVKIHGGTLFDYVFVIDRKMTGKQRTNFIIQQYLEGNVNLIQEKEMDKSENITIRGKSYIMNERTAQQIGFNVIKTNSLERLILINNYFNLLTAYRSPKKGYHFKD